MIKYTLQYDEQFVEKLQDYIKYCIQSFGSYLVYLDLKGLTISGLVNQREWMEDIIQNSGTMQYTDYLVEVRIFNAPIIAKQLYSILSRLLKSIKGKIHFVPKEQSNSTKSTATPTTSTKSILQGV